MCSIISKHTYFLLKVNLHYNLPHFRNVSSTSDLSLDLCENIAFALGSSIRYCPHKLPGPKAIFECKLDGVGPVENGPSSD